MCNLFKVTFSLPVLAVLTLVPTRGEAQTWVRQQQIPSGYSARIFGETVMVIGDDYRAYAYEKSAQGQWGYVTDFASSDPDSVSFGTNSFGAFSLFGDAVLIGDPRATVAGTQLAGAVYAFDRESAGAWIAANKIAEPVPQTQAYFGENAVSMFGNTAILNGSNRHNHTYVLQRSEQGAWTQSATLIPSDGTFQGFYRGAAMFQDTAIVGSVFTNTAPFQSAAYVFERDSEDQWNQVAKLQPSDALVNSGFAMGVNAIALYGNTALIGTEVGTAYVFERDEAGRWEEVGKLNAPVASRIRLFGDTATLGGGAADTSYVFRRDGEGQWSQRGTFSGSTHLFGDFALNFEQEAIEIHELTGVAPGDYDRSGAVEQGDLDLVFSNWNRAEIYPPVGWYSQLPEGAIDQSELDSVVLNWLNTPVPLDLSLGAISGALTANYDLKNNAAIINYTGISPAATVRQQIIAGRGGTGLGKTWNGPGIASSTANAANTAEPESRSIGFAQNASLPLGAYTRFRGETVDDTSVLIAFTRTGDANLDGIVNDDDVTIVSATYAPGVPQPHWALGDFDYNGFVDDDDLTLLGVFYDPSAPPLVAPASAVATGVAVVPVPEPDSAALAAIALVGLAIGGVFHRAKFRRAFRGISAG